MDNMTLVRKYKAGDASALEQLLINSEKMIYNQAYDILKNREDAQDIVQEVCIKLWNGLNNFNEESSFETYLYTIVKNKCCDLMRKNKSILSLDKNVEDNDTTYMDLLDSNVRNNPEEIMMIVFELEETIEKIKDLPKDQQIALIYRTHGYKYEEIAELLNVSINTVKTRVSRAQEKISA